MTNDQTVTQAALEAFAKETFKHGHSEGWSGNQGRRDVQHVDAEKGWQCYVSNGALAKTLERHRLTAHSGEGRSNGAGEDGKLAGIIARALPMCEITARQAGPDYELISARGFEMMTQHPDDIAALLGALPEILAALSAPQGEVERLREALATRTFLTCVSGDGPTPYLKVHFNNLADAHAAHNELLGRKN